MPDQVGGVYSQGEPPVAPIFSDVTCISDPTSVLVEWTVGKDAEDAVERSILDPWRRKTAPRPVFRDPLTNVNDPLSVREYRLR